MNQNRESAGQLLKHFELKKAPVEKVPFKLLGVEFAVNGLWGWIVWLAFFVGGFLNLFLVRRALIRRCRSCWALLSDQESANFSANRDSLPIWMRPLPSEKWVPVMTNGAYADAAMDPLSVLCLILMVACTGVALSVLWIGVLSTPLLRAGTGWQPWILLHAAAICLIFGLLLGLVSAWKNSPDTPAKQSTELLGRRTVVVALISTSAGAIVYFNPVYEILKRILLHEGRHRRLLSVFGKRQRRHKHNVEKMPTGFLKDGEGKIHYVPASGIARSLRANSAGAILFKGPFDREILPYVHHSALVPFARQAVVDLLRGVRHRPKLEERKQLLKTAEIQQRYATAFDLVLAAIERERGMRFRRGAMPNLQLYDLLGDIAINANSGQLIARATDVLKSAQVLSPAPVKKTPRTRSSEPSKTKHNYHCKPSRKTPLSDRRKLHLNAFKGQRIEQVALSIDSSGIGETDIRKGPENPSNPVIFSRGTWDPARVNDETANMQPVVRIRKRVRKNRIHGRVRVKSC